MGPAMTVKTALTPLTAVELEQVRAMRSRLNRVPKGVLGDKSVGPLSKGFFDVCLNVGLEPSPGGPVTVADLTQAASEGDILALRKAVGGMAALKQADAKAWRTIFDLGLMQAILTRRLVLADRERLGSEVN